LWHLTQETAPAMHDAVSPAPAPHKTGGQAVFRPFWGGDTGRAPTNRARPGCENPTRIMSETIDKQQIIEDFRKSDGDTGSCEVQIALLTARIVHLTDHLRTHKKDYHSRRGLIQMTNKRRKLLNYIKRTDLDKYNELLKRLKLRR